MKSPTGNKILSRLNHARKIIDDFYVFDVETTELRAKADVFILGCIYGKNFSKVIHSVDDFKTEFQNERYKGKKVFAHNAEFDLSVIYDNIYFLDPRAIFNGSRFICCSNGICTFADSFNIYTYGVKKIGEYLGLQKSFKTEQYESSLSNLSTEEIINGCFRDCEIVYDALYQYFETVGEIKITKASLAMAYYRRYFMPYNIEHNELRGNYFFSSYYGGRTEAFKIGSVNAVVYDINSSYPNAMKNLRMPNPKNLKHIRKISIERLYEFYLPNYEGCGYFKILHHETYIGFLPYRNKGKLSFPVGTFSGWYNFNEIRFALEWKAIEVLECQEIIFAKSIPSIFSSFVDHEFDLKKNASNPLQKEIHKYNQNCLYGKFGQKIDEETVYIENIEKSLDYIDELQQTNRLKKIVPFNAERLDARLVIKKDQEYRPPFCIPVIPSYITSFSRIHLLETMLKYIEFKPVYCDTDSIFFEIDPMIEDSNELGEWKKEDKIITEIRGLKNYSYVIPTAVGGDGKEHKKIKGIPKNAKEISTNIFQYDNLVKTKESLVRNIETGILVKRTKIINNVYDKREILENGETKPLKI